MRVNIEALVGKAEIHRSFAEPGHGFLHRWVLDIRAGDHRGSALGLGTEGQALHCDIVRLCTGAGEDHLCGIRTQEFSNLLARIFQHTARGSPGGVLAGGVQHMRCLHHRLVRFEAQRLGCSVINIETIHAS